MAERKQVRCKRSLSFLQWSGKIALILEVQMVWKEATKTFLIPSQISQNFWKLNKSRRDPLFTEAGITVILITFLPRIDRERRERGRARESERARARERKRELWEAFLPSINKNANTPDVFYILPRVCSLLISSEPFHAARIFHKPSVSSPVGGGFIPGTHPGGEGANIPRFFSCHPCLQAPADFPWMFPVSSQQVLIMWTNICSLLRHVYPHKTSKDWD